MTDKHTPADHAQADQMQAWMDEHTKAVAVAYIAGGEEASIRALNTAIAPLSTQQRAEYLAVAISFLSAQLVANGVVA